MRYPWWGTGALSRYGNHYALVVCGDTTCYPEAVPLRTIDTEHVAEALVVLFSRDKFYGSGK